MPEIAKGGKDSSFCDNLVLTVGRTGSHERSPATADIHPTYVRLPCLHVRRRGVSLAAALAGTGMTWRQLLHEKRLIAFGEEFGHVTPDPALRGRCLALKLGRAVGPI